MLKHIFHLSKQWKLFLIICTDILNTYLTTCFRPVLKNVYLSFDAVGSLSVQTALIFHLGVKTLLLVIHATLARKRISPPRESGDVCSFQSDRNTMPG